MSTPYTKLSAISDLSLFSDITVNTNKITYSASHLNFALFNNISIEISRKVDDGSIHSSKMCLSSLMRFLSACIYDETHAPYIRLSNETRDITLASNTGNGWTKASLGEFLTKNDTRNDSSFLRVDGNDIGGNLPYIKLNNETRTITANTLSVKCTNNLIMLSPTISLSSSYNTNILNSSGILLSSTKGISCITTNNCKIQLSAVGAYNSSILLHSTTTDESGILVCTEGTTNKGIKFTTTGSYNSGIKFNTQGQNNSGVSIETQLTAPTGGISLLHNGDNGQISIKTISNVDNDANYGIVLLTSKTPILINSGNKFVEVQNTYKNTAKQTLTNTIKCTATAALWN